MKSNKAFFLLCIFFIGGCMNKDNDTTEKIDVELNDYLWENRIVVIFTDTLDNPNYHTFKEEWLAHSFEINDRNLILIEIFKSHKGYINNKILTEDAVRTITAQMNPQSNTFEILLIGKDGNIKLRTGNPSLEQIFSLIDTMPMRKSEMRRMKDG